jgi:hypothetical protein
MIGGLNMAEKTHWNLKLVRFPCSFAPALVVLPCSRALPRARASYLAALPSTRAIETRLLPSSLAATQRGFAFYVAFPKRSIPSLATCSTSRVPRTLLYLARSRSARPLPSRLYRPCLARRSLGKGGSLIPQLH